VLYKKVVAAISTNGSHNYQSSLLCCHLENSKGNEFVEFERFSPVHLRLHCLQLVEGTEDLLLFFLIPSKDTLTNYKTLQLMTTELLMLKEKPLNKINNVVYYI